MELLFNIIQPSDGGVVEVYDDEAFDNFYQYSMENSNMIQVFNMEHQYIFLLKMDGIYYVQEILESTFNHSNCSYTDEKHKIWKASNFDEAVDKIKDLTLLDLKELYKRVIDNELG